MLHMLKIHDVLTYMGEYDFFLCKVDEDVVRGYKETETLWSDEYIKARLYDLSQTKKRCK